MHMRFLKNQTANVVHSLHCTRYQKEELNLSQSGWNARLVLLKLNAECESLENAYETPLCKSAETRPDVI